MSVRALTRLFLLTSLLWAMPLVAQRDWDAVEIRTVPLSGGVYMLMGSGGNIGLSVGVDGAFVVDDQFAPLTEKIKAAIAGVTDQPVKWVLNTHWHGDHTGGNENFGGEGALIVAHDNVYRRLNPAEFSELVGRSQQAPNAALPVVTFDEAMTFHWNGEDIHAFHVEHAHTDGDVIIHYRGSDIYHMGDTFFKGRFPFIDVDSGGNVDGVIAAADLVLRMSGSSTRLIPGHGELATRDDLREYREMLSTVRSRVAQLVRDGKTQDEAVAARPTADLDAAWGATQESAEGFVALVYRSLTEGR
jgi:glyoxylase-like metal-dependent hydrolase (beta-lactamase superfamily II)